MIVLASNDEGVVLQFIDQIDQSNGFSNICVSTIYYFSLFNIICNFIKEKNNLSYIIICFIQNNHVSNKRKVPLVENLDDPTSVKMPKLSKFF